MKLEITVKEAEKLIELKKAAYPKLNRNDVRHKQILLTRYEIYVKGTNRDRYSFMMERVQFAQFHI